MTNKEFHIGVHQQTKMTISVEELVVQETLSILVCLEVVMVFIGQ